METWKKYTSFVVVFVRQSLAWYVKNPANSRETKAKNIIISICVLYAPNNHCHKTKNYQ